jgi:cell division transport system ATP-binding protein
VVVATHDHAMVDALRKRVIELHAGRLVRDEAHGRYESFEATAFPPTTETAFYSPRSTQRAQSRDDAGTVESHH